MIASIIGGGSWGSAFSIHLGRKEIETKLWIREPEIYDSALIHRENKTFLPGVEFPRSVSFHNDLKQALKDADIVFIAVPSEYCREMYEKISPLLVKNQIIVSLTKGIEYKSLKRMSELMQEIFEPEIKSRIAVLSGPSFAREVSEYHPTAVVVASKEAWRRACRCFEKHYSHICRHIRRAWIWEKYNGSSHNKGHSRDNETGNQNGCQAGHFFWTCRHRRPGPYLHRKIEQEQACRV